MVEVVWLVSLFLFDFLEEWSTFGKPFECHCEGGKPLWGRSRGCCHPHGSELQLELLSFWGEKMHLSFLQSFAVLAALFFFVETERNDESISTILHSPWGRKTMGRCWWNLLKRLSSCKLHIILGTLFYVEGFSVTCKLTSDWLTGWCEDSGKPVVVLQAMWGSLDYYVESPDMGDLLEELFFL